MSFTGFEIEFMRRVEAMHRAPVACLSWASPTLLKAYIGPITIESEGELMLMYRYCYTLDTETDVIVKS